MKLVSFYLPEVGGQVGLWREDGVYSLTRMDPQRFRSVEHLIRAAEDAGVSPRAWVAQAVGNLGNRPDVSWDALAAELVPPPEERDRAKHPFLLPPLIPVEVWAAGVTYGRSREARETETTVRSIYDKVYEAERPEIFLKATGQRVIGPGDRVGIRRDSTWQVPEPELGLVLNGRGHIVGLTVGNDMSCRDIEGENPLYLAQAKIFRRSCAIGPSVRLVDGPIEPVSIRCRILRDGQEVFAGETSTRELKRSYDELVSFLRRDNWVYTPTVLLTGTGIVPPDDFTCQPGDVIEIEATGLGTLRNSVDWA